jgi:hypothetical protein
MEESSGRIKRNAAQDARMSTWIAITFLLLVSLAGLLSNLLLLPGNWMMVAAAVVFAMFSDSARGPTWLVVGLTAGLAGAGELLELLLGSAKAAKKGASRRAVVLSLVMSMAGSFAGTLLVPIPIIGTLIGAITGAAVGAFGGAWLGEAWVGSNLARRTEISTAAMSGRMWGMAAKFSAGLAIFVVLLVSVFVRRG